jgi:pimeloyl-ACP methyl ester carboxylesterase
VQDFYRQLLGPREAFYQEEVHGLLPLNQDPEWLAQGLDYLRSRDLRGVLPQVEAQALVILHGDRDRITAAVQSYFLQEQLPWGRLVILPGAGHVPMVSCSKELNDIIADFL